MCYIQGVEKGMRSTMHAGSVMMGEEQNETAVTDYVEDRDNLPGSPISIQRAIDVIQPQTTRPILVYTHDNSTTTSNPTYLSMQEIAIHLPQSGAIQSNV
jgi:hypothetical protein